MRRIVLITESLDCGPTKEQSLEPLTRRRRDLRRIGLDVVSRVAARGRKIGAAIASARDKAKADVVVFAPHFKEDPAALRGTLAEAHAKRDRPAIVLLDTFDQSSSPLLGCLDVVDRYAKKLLLRDRSAYLRDLAGGYVFTDWLAREQSFDLRGWHFGSRAPNKGSLGKLCLAWNFAAARRYARLRSVGRLLRRLPGSPTWQGRPVDVNARFAPAAVNHGDWYATTRRRLREQVEAACAPLTFGGKVNLGPAGRVGMRTYLREQRRSKVTVSPFGYGELCLRDVEAIAAGSLLVKPDVSHLEVSPELFVASETYLPIRWDGSDVGDVLRGAIRDADRSEAMVANASARFGRYVDERGWVEEAQRVFAGLG